MQTDDESQTTLSKWPFILGDILLVATALAISILGNWQLTDWQVAACVMAVALGAALFVLPYVVEFQVRVREEQEDRAADLRILEKHILSAKAAVDAADARIRALESVAANMEAPNSALEDMLDSKLAALQKEQAKQDETIAALQQEIDAVPKETPMAFDPAVLKPLEDRIAALEKRPVKSEAKAAKPIDEKAPPPAEKKPPAKPEKSVSQIERPKRSARERHGPEESRLLKRAIGEKQDSSSSAVSRIIESKQKEASEIMPAQTNDKLEKKKPQLQKIEPKPEPPDRTGKQISKAAPNNEKTEPNSSPAKKGADAPTKEIEPTLGAEKSASKDDTLNLDAEVPALDSSDMLFDDATVSLPIKKKRAKKNDAVLTASVFIGIGNKPYLRGSGGGLNWDKGLVMEFQEIGKWRWVAPSHLDEALEVQLYRNDEDPDKSGKYTIEPGQKLEVSPVF